MKFRTVMGRLGKGGLEGRIPQERKFSRKQKRTIKEMDAVSEVSGSETAEILDEVEDDKELYEYSLRCTLEKYYEEPENFEEQLRDIKDNIENNMAEEILAEYEEASQERALADELDYSTENIIVVFEPETDDSYIKAVAEEQFGELENTNITGEVDVTGLPEKKVEQIQKEIGRASCRERV